MAKIPEFVTSLPPEALTLGATVYWWTGKEWRAHQFVNYYMQGRAVKLRLKGRERIAKPEEVISRERYLQYKASQFRK